MSFTKISALALTFLLFGASASLDHSYTAGPSERADWPDRGADISVLTYNVKGLPWPIARKRGAPLRTIGERLALMRKRGVQPRVVLLQEAFTDEAEALAKEGQYKFIARGPDSRQQRNWAISAKFHGNAQWSKGERIDPILSSGLIIMSDFPIVKVRSLAFPSGACAGYDCLAAKGVMIAWVSVPGSSTPIAIANTHLNSRRSTRVSQERADAAFAWQSEAVRNFVYTEVATEEAVIFGGDFNAGSALPRRVAFAANPPLGLRQQDALLEAIIAGSIISSSRQDALDTVLSNRDKILFRSGENAVIRIDQAWVPFGDEEGSPPLSDHTGFVIDFSMSPKAREGPSNSKSNSRLPISVV